MTDITAAKSIAYNRESRDFDATFDGNYIGSFPNYSAAEDALNDHVLRLLEDGLLDTPLAALDPADGVPGIDDNDPSAPADPDPSPGRRLVFAYTAISCKGCRRAIIAEAQGWLCPECAAQDQKARAWSLGLLEQIITAADASVESYASLV